MHSLSFPKTTQLTLIVILKAISPVGVSEVSPNQQRHRYKPHQIKRPVPP